MFVLSTSSPRVKLQLNEHSGTTGHWVPVGVGSSITEIKSIEKCVSVNKIKVKKK